MVGSPMTLIWPSYRKIYNALPLPFYRQAPLKRGIIKEMGYLRVSHLFIAIFCALLFVSAPSYAQCIPGLPCVDPGAEDAPQSGSGACDANFMNQIYARAAIETEREITMAGVGIRIPDSVLEYTCFDHHAYKAYEDSKSIFSGEFTREIVSQTTIPGDGSPPPEDTTPTSGGSYQRTGSVSIDYDGDPRSYCPSPCVGNDFLANAGSPGNWWGIATENNSRSGTAYVQTSEAGDSYPGYYVSKTAWMKPDRRIASGHKDWLVQENYVDAQIIPYVATTKYDYDQGIRNGDFVLLTNNSNGKQICAIVADYAASRPMNHAEMSPEAARLLGITFTKRGVTSSQTVTQEFYDGSAISGFWPVGDSGKQTVLNGPCNLTDPPVTEDPPADDDVVVSTTETRTVGNSYEAFILPIINKYLEDNFSHKFLGRNDDDDIDFEIGEHEDRSVNCSLMSEISNLARCTDFDMDSHQFFSFETLTGLDPRIYPESLKCTNTGVTQDFIDIANNKDFAFVDFDIDTSHEDLLADSCSTPIPTGMSVYTIDDITVDASANINPTDRIVDEMICINPLCYYDGSTCQKK